MLRVEDLSRAVGVLIPMPLREACSKHAWQAANREGRRVVRPRHVATSIRNDPGLRTFKSPQGEDEDEDEEDGEDEEDEGGRQRRRFLKSQFVLLLQKR